MVVKKNTGTSGGTAASSSSPSSSAASTTAGSSSLLLTPYSISFNALSSSSSSSGSTSSSKASSSPPSSSSSNSSTNASSGSDSSATNSPKNFKVLTINGTLEMSEFYNFTVTFLTEFDMQALGPEAFIGKQATLTFNNTANGPTSFYGEVTAFSIQSILSAGEFTNYITYEVNISSASYVLLSNMNTQVYLNQTVLQIVEVVLKRANVNYLSKVNASFLKILSSYVRPFTFQYEETDANFVKRMLERAGMFFYFDFANGKEQLILANNSASANPNPNIASLQFGKYSSSSSTANSGLYYNMKTLYAVTPKEVTVHTYDYNFHTQNTSTSTSGSATTSSSSTKKTSSSTTSSSTTAANSSSSVSTNAVQSKHLNAGYSFSRSSTAATSMGTLQKWVPDLSGNEELKEYLNVFFLSEAWQAETYQVFAFANVYLPGYTLGLDSYSSAFFTDSMYVLKTEYDISVEQAVYHTMSIEVEAPPERMSCAVSGIPRYKSVVSSTGEKTNDPVRYFKPMNTPTPTISGFIPAFVDGTTKSTVEVNNLGEYVIQLPIVTTEPGKGSSWIRKLESQANTDTATFFPLQQGTEVLLSFQNGNPDVPIIMGAVPNITCPSTVTSENSTYSGFKAGPKPPASSPLNTKNPNSSTRSPKAVEELTSLQGELTQNTNWNATAFAIAYTGSGATEHAATIAFPNGSIKHFTSAQIKEINTRDVYQVNLGNTYAATLGNSHYITYGDSTSEKYGTSTSTVYGNAEGANEPNTDYDLLVSQSTIYGSSVHNVHGNSTNVTYGNSTNTIHGNENSTTDGNTTSVITGDENSTTHGMSKSSIYGVTVETMYGNTTSTTFGAMEAFTFGGSNTVMLGEGMMAFIGLNVMINMGATYGVNIGPQEHFNYPEENNSGLNGQFMYEGTIVLQCGASIITMTPASIDIITPVFTITSADVDIMTSMFTVTAGLSIFL